MFKWLAKLFLELPVSSSGCPCCEKQRIRLEKMRQSVVNGELPEPEDISQKTENIGFSQCKNQNYTVKEYGVFFQDGDGKPIKENTDAESICCRPDKR